MIDYSEFMLTDNHSYNVYCALKYCKETGEDGIYFPKGTYNFYSDMASEKHINVANHGIRCLVRIAFLIDNMRDFTVDGGNSEFIFHGAVMPFAIINSKNIKIKNFSIDYETTMTMEARVEEVCENYVLLEPDKDQDWYTEGNALYITDSYGRTEKYAYMTLKGKYGENKYMPYSRDSFVKNLCFDTENGKLKLSGTDLNLQKDMLLILQTCSRYASGVFADNSKDVEIRGYTARRSYGMGVLAQKTENVTVDNMRVMSGKGREVSLAGDGVHFVSCKGLIKVCNSHFEEQYDDALNIHGIFNRIEDIGENYIIIKYVHADTKGIDIYKNGDKIQVLNSETLIPYREYLVDKVEIINSEYTKLYVNNTDGICIGDVTESLSWVCDLLFENNKVINNRGRGMLVAAKGKVEILKNYFNTPGAAIMFESDGRKWFESGGTTDVNIKDNIFENCLYGSADNWGSAVIDFMPRIRFDGNSFYHKSVEISGNSFINNAHIVVRADNIERVSVINNKITNQIGEKAVFKNCRDVRCDM